MIIVRNFIHTLRDLRAALRAARTLRDIQDIKVLMHPEFTHQATRWNGKIYRRERAIKIRLRKRHENQER